MDELLATHIALTNLLTKGVDLHNSIATKLDLLQACKDNKATDVVNLPHIGQEFKDILEIYKQVKDLAIVYDYLAGNDLYTVMNDFKLSKPTILKLLKGKGIALRPSAPNNNR